MKSGGPLYLHISVGSCYIIVPIGKPILMLSQDPLLGQLEE